MIKKGKFKLLSYIVDENLIFYKSLNRNRKYTGFFAIKTTKLFPLISILNNFLNKRFIKYYSLQVDNKKVEDFYFFINIENTTKNETIKLWNLIKDKIDQKKIDITILKTKSLEKAFIGILDENISNDIFILKDTNVILMKDNQNFKKFIFYKMNFENLKNKTFFIQTFLNYINNLNLFGYLIFNFKLNFNNSINVAAYFSEVLEKNQTSDNIIIEVNNFFNIDLLEKRKIGIKNMGLFLWRYSIFNNFYSVKDLSELFKTDIPFDFNNIQQFNQQFEQALLKEYIKFKRINENIIFIFKDILFITFYKCDPNLLLKIFKKYYSRYLIYLLVFNEIDHNELLKMELNLLKNVKILNTNEFLNLDLSIFKN